MIDFVIVGTFKSASSTLAWELGQRTEIEIPTPKDPYYFLAQLAGSYTGPEAFLQAHYAGAVTDAASFDAMFGQKPGALRGEATPLYMYCHEQAIPALQIDNPDARIVIVLRNPVDRAFSNYKHNVKDGYETRPFTECIATWEKTEHLPRHPFFHYVRAGLYDAQVAAWQAAFENVLVVSYADVAARPHQVLNEIAGFLGITPDFEPREVIRLNKSGKPRSRVLHDFIRQENPVKSILRPIYRALVSNRATRKALSERVKNFNLKSGDLPASERAALIAVYADDIARLATRPGCGFAKNWLS